MKKITLLYVALLALSSCHRNTAELDGTLTRDFLMFSKEKAKDYRMWVQLPEGYEATKTYPSIYVLDPDDDAKDGNSNFTYVAKLCQQFSKELNKQNVIVVGIRLGDYREIDYTPTKFTTKGFLVKVVAKNLLILSKKNSSLVFKKILMQIQVAQNVPLLGIR